MRTIVVCPKCGVESERISRVRVVCRHAYHAPEDCTLCGWCRNNLPWPPEEDEPARKDT